MIRAEIKDLIQKFFPNENIIIDYVPAEKKGDYSTNIAMKLSARTSRPAMEIAQEIISKISSPMITETIIYEPGFINFVINKDYLIEKFQQDTGFQPNLGKGLRINVEFVSVNPTGPINIVNARAAAFGDALVRMLNYAGYSADAEYYINDAGRQIELLTESVQQRIKQIQGKEWHIPEDGYHGEYILPLAREIIDKNIRDYEEIKKFSVNYFINMQRETLRKFGVIFKNWISESSIRDQGYIDRVLQVLKEKNLVFEKDGALYFKSTEFSDSRDRVIITSDNRYTYLLPDIAYHQNKIERKYEKLITILGPDHLGQVKSLTSGLVALGYPEEILKVIIVQEVKLKKNGKYVTMSKRAGTVMDLEELLQSIPVDVIRFFLLLRSCSQHLDFDIDLALKESEENPVYYVQYAHARIMSILKYAEESGIELEQKSPDLSYLKEKEEFEIIKQVLKFPEVIEDAVVSLDPFSLTHYLIGLARCFHYFYQKHRVVGVDKNLTLARLFLVKKNAWVLRKGLELLGISCPERM